MFALTRHKVFLIGTVAMVALLTLGVSYRYVSIGSIRIGTGGGGDSESNQTEPPASTLSSAPEPVPDPEPEIPLVPPAEMLYKLKPVREAAENITSTVFMFRGDFSSDFYDIFTLHKRATRYCDKDTTVDGCDVRLPRNYKWWTLSSKLVDALEVMCKEPEKTDFYVKIDDDLIMSERKLDEVIRRMAATDCQVAGGIAADHGYYWPVGQVYIFTRAILERLCLLYPITRELHSSEDITFGRLLNSSDTSMFCNLDRPRNHWHKDYKDRRVRISHFTQHNE
ncbi:hypothetical protein GGI11_004600 [Coemansia sp. RSA 2049]|nr:hypothetical protein H4217_006854 [Coemansia sp. RSA 1939]KAJ2512861.1 hypothetical protein GGI11_004600 [Coemansia sp. RSA 2049]KAJ2609723.1 hypothetical protein EV177_004324 [Coemansia sp. RSA 1804]KAJ2692008.1 hypothetical protein GGH99_002013 [Coemansia sp. RSA 1285]